MAIKSFHEALNDPQISDHLFQIARKHVKLALEHSQSQLTKQRREAIRDEINALRNERDAILLTFDLKGMI